jgi:hypothetical protein
MQKCCAEKIVEMQADVQAGKWLKLLLAASPFILVIPNLDPTTDLKGARDFIVEEVAKIAAEKALSNIRKGASLPDFADACRAAGCLTVGNLAKRASEHMLRHMSRPEFFMWQQMSEAYTAAVRDGNCSEPATGGWLPWVW